MQGVRLDAVAGSKDVVNCRCDAPDRRTLGAFLRATRQRCYRRHSSLAACPTQCGTYTVPRQDVERRGLGERFAAKRRFVCVLEVRSTARCRCRRRWCRHGQRCRKGYDREDTARTGAAQRDETAHPGFHVKVVLPWSKFAVDVYGSPEMRSTEAWAQDCRSAERLPKAQLGCGRGCRWKARCFLASTTAIGPTVPIARDFTEQLSRPQAQRTIWLCHRYRFQVNEGTFSVADNQNGAG